MPSWIDKYGQIFEVFTFHFWICPSNLHEDVLVAGEDYKFVQ